MSEVDTAHEEVAAREASDERLCSVRYHAAELAAVAYALFWLKGSGAEAAYTSHIENEFRRHCEELSALLAELIPAPTQSEERS